MEKRLPPRNSSNIQFWPLPASTWGFFSAFNLWNFLLATFLSGKYLFRNAAFQVNTTIIHTVEFVVAVQEVSPFYNFVHTPGKSLTWAFNSTGVVGGGGWGSPTELAQLAVPKKAPLLSTRCGVGKHSYENFYLASVLNGFKKFCILRMEMLIYLFWIFYLKLKLFGK